MLHYNEKSKRFHDLKNGRFVKNSSGKKSSIARKEYMEILTEGKNIIFSIQRRADDFTDYIAKIMNNINLNNYVVEINTP